jgi:hypothetical protein
VRKICASLRSPRQSSPCCGPSAYEYDELDSEYILGPHPLSMQRSCRLVLPSDLFLEVMLIDSTFYNTDLSLTIFNMMAALQGLVSMKVDMTGYGESSSLVPSPFERGSVGTATLPVYHKVRSIIVEEAGGETKLIDRVSFCAYSECGYNSIAAADSFENSGIKVEHVYAGGSAIKTSS